MVEHKVDQLTLTEGHTIRYAEVLPNFASRLPFNFEKTFTVTCREIPTSWRILVKFQRFPDDDVSCIVFIQRTDSIKIGCRTDFWMRVMPQSKSAIFCSRNLRARGMFPGIQARGIVGKIMPRELLMHLGNGDLLFEFFFWVHGCHGSLGFAYIMPRDTPPVEQQEMIVSRL